ncbi:TPA_asm: internalin [Listeria monocytogenes]|nr:internalin [Listeria monocytogenes]
MSKYDGSFPGTYVWEKTKVKAADVTAKYLDENGNTISDDVVKNGNVGDSYTTEQKAIPGYTFKAVQGNPTGQFTSDAQTVTYIYTKDPVAGGNVTVKYVDGAGGNTISDNVVKSGNIGDDYSTDQKAIPGYTFKEVQGSASGQFTDKEQTITYVYTKNSVTPVKPTEPGTTQTNENNTETPVKNTTNVSLHNNVSTLGSVSTTNEKSLPTTGEKPANWSVVVGGLITLTAATVLYLLKRKY